MTYGQPGEPWQRRPDDQSWREYDSSGHRRRGFTLTDKQALIGLVVLLVVLIAGAEVIAANEDFGLKATILIPRDGVHLHPGPVILRISYTADDYQLYYSGPDNGGDWQLFAAGRSSIETPIDLPPLGVTQPGAYKLRLVVSDRRQGATKSVSLRFTVEP